MTTIVALHVPGDGTWIGSDGCATCGNLKFHALNKWVQRNGWGIGVSGHMRALNVIHHDIAKIIMPRNNSPHLIGMRMLEALNNAGCKLMTDDDDLPFPSAPAQILLASRQGVWSLDGSLSYTPVEGSTLWSAGSGSHYALGAGEALDYLPPRQRIEKTLQIAARFDPFSNAPFYVEKIS